VTSLHDLETLGTALAAGRLFAEPSTLTTMQSWIPTDQTDVEYGLGLFRVVLDAGRGSLWGHDGYGNSFMYMWPEQGVVFTGTLNQTENDWWPLVDDEVGRIAGASAASGVSPRALTPLSASRAPRAAAWRRPRLR
jgi:hypothetical protein